jgi:hypothetical protein
LLVKDATDDGGIKHSGDPAPARRQGQYLLTEGRSGGRCEPAALIEPQDRRVDQASRLQALMTATFVGLSTPSISLSSCATIVFSPRPGPPGRETLTAIIAGSAGSLWPPSEPWGRWRLPAGSGGASGRVESRLNAAAAR